MSLGSLGGSEAAAVSSFFQRDADSYGNDETLELQWAMKAYHHAETYFNILISVDPSILKLTQIDDEIYKTFRKQFKDMKIDVVDETQLKSKESKEEWRAYCNLFENRVEDWNMGTLLRINSADDVNENNTTLVPRIQFLAIEIARNREGLNSGLKEAHKKTKAAD